LKRLTRKLTAPFRFLRRTLFWAVCVVLAVVVGGVLLYRIVPPPVTPLMVIRLFEGEGLSKDWTPLDEMSPYISRSVVALEDNLFCEHNGFDWGSLKTAVVAYGTGESAGGASTITMQTAKNLFLWPRRHVIRKIVEMPIAGLIELLWDKPRIIEVYLNIAEWGPGLYGAEAAAQAYFGKPAAKVTPWEAALMASVLPNPRNWSPTKAGGRVNKRARSARKRIRQLGPLLNCLPKG